MKKSSAAALRRSTAFLACQKRATLFLQFVLEILGIHPQPVKVLEPLRLLGNSVPQSGQGSLAHPAIQNRQHPDQGVF